MRIAIAGGGIAGTAAAIALSGSNHEIVVYERAPEPREVGAGIQLSPNAMRLLERWDVAPRLAASAVENQAIDIHDGRSGRCLTSIPLGQSARARYGAPYYLIHRADLLAAMIDEAATRPDIAFRFASPVGAVRNEDGIVRFEVAGDTLSADLLVAADGIRSTVRGALFRLPGSSPLGRVAWRGGLPVARLPSGIRADATGLWLGSGAHLVHYPVSGGALLNVVFIAAHESEMGGLPGAGLAGPARALVDAVGEDWTLWPLEHLSIPRLWSQGRVVLIGDAAHAMSPSAAQGGAQAIEDAFALAAALGAFGDIDTALAAFSAARRPRVARIARDAQRNMRIYELGGPAALARNLAISALPPRTHLSRLDWIYSGGVTKFS